MSDFYGFFFFLKVSFKFFNSGIAVFTGANNVDYNYTSTYVVLRLCGSMHFPMETSIKNLTNLRNLSLEQFIDLCIFLGCDYCDKIPDPKSAFKHIHEHKSIKEILKKLDKKHPVPENFLYSEARRWFRKPEVTSAKEIKIKWEKPDKEGHVKYMCEHKGFAEDRNYTSPMVLRLRGSMHILVETSTDVFNVLVFDKKSNEHHDISINNMDYNYTTLMVLRLRGSMQIFLKTSNSKTITLEALNYINNIATNLGAGCPLPSSDSLKIWKHVDGKAIEMADILGGNLFDKKSNLYHDISDNYLDYNYTFGENQDHRIRGSMQIFVKTSNSKTITLEVEQFKKIKNNNATNLRADRPLPSCDSLEILKLVDGKAIQMADILGGTLAAKQLEDRRTFSDYNIQKESTLQAEYSNISDILNISKSNFGFNLSSLRKTTQTIHDGRTLSDYNTRKKSTLHSVLRLRGGMQILVKAFAIFFILTSLKGAEAQTLRTGKFYIKEEEFRLGRCTNVINCTEVESTDKQCLTFKECDEEYGCQCPSGSYASPPCKMWRCYVAVWVEDPPGDGAGPSQGGSGDGGDGSGDGGDGSGDLGSGDGSGDDGSNNNNNNNNNPVYRQAPFYKSNAFYASMFIVSVVALTLLMRYLRKNPPKWLINFAKMFGININEKNARKMAEKAAQTLIKNREGQEFLRNVIVKADALDRFFDEMEESPTTSNSKNNDNTNMSNALKNKSSSTMVVRAKIQDKEDISPDQKGLILAKKQKDHLDLVLRHRGPQELELEHEELLSKLEKVKEQLNIPDYNIQKESTPADSVKMSDLIKSESISPVSGEDEKIIKKDEDVIINIDEDVAKRDANFQTHSDYFSQEGRTPSDYNIQKESSDNLALSFTNKSAIAAKDGRTLSDYNIQKESSPKLDVSLTHTLARQSAIEAKDGRTPSDYNIQKESSVNSKLREADAHSHLSDYKIVSCEECPCHEEEHKTTKILSPDSFKIVVKLVDGKTITLDVEPSDTIENVKTKIQDKEGISIEKERRLKFKGRLLQDEQKTLKDCDIKKNSKIKLEKKIPAYRRGNYEKEKNVSVQVSMPSE